MTSTSTATPTMTDPIHALSKRFPDAVLETGDASGVPSVTVASDHLLDVGRFLRDDLGFDLLSNLTVVDQLKLPPAQKTDGTRFVGVYHLRSVARNGELLQVKSPLPGGDEPVAPSVTSIWPGANWHEREAYDLFGVRYEGHPDLRRILMPDDWPGHPLRKDMPLGGERVPFSVTWDDDEFKMLGRQIMQPEQKPQALPKGMDGRHMVVNMGPQHPSTHGVLRLIVELDGERILNVAPDIGYLHSGFEKQGEHVRYKDFVYYTDRMDYVSATQNNLSYVLAVEQLLGIEAPPRAQGIRVIMAELQRIAAHLVWLGTHVLDISGTGHALLMYAFREREEILDLFEMACGARLTTSYMRIGGVADDLPPAFIPRLVEFLDYMDERLDEYQAMLEKNPLWRKRLEGIGPLSKKDAIAMGVTGPMLRGSGIAYDLRRAQPYCGYDQYEFDIPTSDLGDSYGRYLVRMAEMKQSVRILRQAAAMLPEGDYLLDDPKIVPPKRDLLDQSMEALIHHFKLYTEGVTPPPGEVYRAIEAPKGEMGFYIISDGSAHPYRLRIRTPSFANLQSIDMLAKGHLFSDLVVIIGTIDIVLGDVDR